MHPHTALLLLLCSLLTTNAAQVKCHRSLIKGVTNAEIHFDSATKMLTCVRKENNLMMIHLNVPAKDEIFSMPHEVISCDDASGWKTEWMYIAWTNTEYREHKIADALSTLNISCVEYCPSSGAAMRFEKEERRGAESSFDDDPITLLHAYSADEKCDIYYGWRKVALPLSCNPYNGWHDTNGYLVTSERKVPQRFECVPKGVPPPPCTVELLNEYKDLFDELDVDSHTGTLTCRSIDDTSKSIVLSIHSPWTTRRFDSLICDGQSWIGAVTRFNEIAAPVKISDAKFPLRVACAQYILPDCNQRLIRIYGSNKNKVKFYDRTLTCVPKPNALMMIHFKEKDGSTSPPHASLTCDPVEGWTTKKIIPIYGTNKDDPKYEAHKIAESKSLLHVECVEYCASTGPGFAVNPKSMDESDERDKYSLLNLYVEQGKCNMYYDWRSVRNSAYCSPYDGWYAGSDELLTREVRVAQPFVGTCRGAPLPPCIVTQKSYTYENFVGLNIDLATRTLTCRDKSNSFADIKFDSKRYPSLQCDEVQGWTSKQSRLEDGTLIVTEERIADASSKLEIECEPICAVSGAMIKFHKNGDNAEVACPEGHKLFFGETYVTSAKCSPNNGTWTMFTQASKDFQVRLKVDLDCKPVCPAPKITSAAHFDNGTKTLTCDSANDSLVGIEFNSDLYTSLTCDDFEGWKGIVHEKKQRNLASTSALIDYTCVKYCTTSGRGLAFNASDEKTKISVKCKQEGARLIYDAKPIYDVVCDLQGWQSKGQKFRDDTTTPLDVYCEAPRHTAEDPLSEEMTSTREPPHQEGQAQSSSSVVIGSAVGIVLFVIVAAAVVVVVVLRKRKRPANSDKGADGKAGKKGNEKSDANVVSSG